MPIKLGPRKLLEKTIENLQATEVDRITFNCIPVLVCHKKFAMRRDAGPREVVSESATTHQSAAVSCYFLETDFWTRIVSECAVTEAQSEAQQESTPRQVISQCAGARLQGHPLPTSRELVGTQGCNHLPE